MAKIIMMAILLSFSANGETSPFLKGKITWPKIKRLEAKMEAWSEKVGEKDLIAIGKMRQRPHEVKVIRYFFPHLLPEKFFGRNMDLSCYSDFKKFEKKQDSANYKEWHDCLRSLYNDTLPDILQRAAKDLKPSK